MYIYIYIYVSPVYIFLKQGKNQYFFRGSSGRGMKAGSYYLCIQLSKAGEEPRFFLGEQWSRDESKVILPLYTAFQSRGRTQIFFWGAMVEG